MNLNLLKISLLYMLNTGLAPIQHQQSRLPLLSARSNFKYEVLDNILKGTMPPSGILMLKITKERVDTCVGKGFELRLTTLAKDSYKFLSPINYSGYFNYKNHLVLVYGDIGVVDFFIKSTTSKYFDFLDYKPVNNLPPVAIEPFVYVYSVKNNKCTLVDSGMLLSFQ
jgi:hypothetical protein